MRKRGLLLAVGLCMVMGLAGCKEKEQGTDLPVQEDMQEQEVSGSQLEEEEGMAVQKEAEPGMVLNEEEISVLKHGELVTETFTRVRGSFNYSIAYEAEDFTYSSEDGIDRISSAGQKENGGFQAYLSISEVLDYTAEDLAAGLVLQSGSDDCVQEETVIGEGEYLVTRIAYTDPDSADSREYYILGQDDGILLLELGCVQDEELYAELQVILSTLKFEV